MRKSWDEYFLDVAEMVATRATCPRRQVGCVIVKDNRIVATGYNGAPPGAPHCTDVGCIMKDNHCLRTIHAEANALRQVDKQIKYTTLYTTDYPCDKCIDKILEHNTVHVVKGITLPANRIERIVYKKDYPSRRTLDNVLEVLQLT